MALVLLKSNKKKEVISACNCIEHKLIFPNHLILVNLVNNRFISTKKIKIKKSEKEKESLQYRNPSRDLFIRLQGIYKEVVFDYSKYIKREWITQGMGSRKLDHPMIVPLVYRKVLRYVKAETNLLPLCNDLGQAVFHLIVYNQFKNKISAFEKCGFEEFLTLLLVDDSFAILEETGETTNPICRQLGDVALCPFLDERLIGYRHHIERTGIVQPFIISFPKFEELLEK